MQFTTIQILEIVGISRRTLQNWLKQGKVKKEKTQGKKKLWTSEDVKDLMNIKHGLVEDRTDYKARVRSR